MRINAPSTHRPDQQSSSVLVVPPLDRETRIAVDTKTAAFHLNRAPQTLRLWACLESGPLLPMRINGRLAWPVAELRRVLGITGDSK